MLKLPGLVKKLCGTDIPEYTYVAPDDGKAYADWDGVKLHADIFNDLLEAEGTGKVEARYEGTYYEGVPALISNEVGKGKVYYFGGAFSEETVEAFIRKLNMAEPYKNIITLPSDCEIAVREKDGKEYVFVLNYSKDAVNIELSKPMKDLITGSEENGAVILDGYGVKVYVAD